MVTITSTEGYCGFASCDTHPAVKVETKIECRVSNSIGTGNDKSSEIQSQLANIVGALADPGVASTGESIGALKVRQILGFLTSTIQSD